MKDQTFLNTKKYKVEEVINTQKSKIESLNKAAQEQAKRLGEQDGTLNLPRTEDTMVSPNERMLKHEFQKMIAECWHAGKPYLDNPHLEYQTIGEEMDNIRTGEGADYDKALLKLEEQKRDAKAFLNQNYANKESELKDYDKLVQRDYVQSKSVLAEVQDKVGRSSPIIHFKSTILYLLLLLGIGICEVPLNLQIFQKFGEAFFITIIMASSLAIAIPVLAHFTGVFIKQRKEKREYGWFALMAVLLFVVFNFGISIFRAYVLAEQVGESANQLNIVIFTCLNLILFSIGVLAAYFRHDESYELEYAYEKFQKEKKKYDKEKLELHARTKALSEEKSGKLKVILDDYLKGKMQLDRREENLFARRKEATRSYDELLNAFVAMEDYIDACYRTAVEQYRAANLMHRKNHLSPQSWQQEITGLEFKFTNCMELDPN